MKEQTLSPLRTYRFSKDDGFTLAQLRELFSINFERNGCACDFLVDEVQTKGLLKENPPCLVISSSEHGKDYFTFVCYKEETRTHTLLYIKVGGKSKQAKYDIFAKNVKVFNGSVHKGVLAGIRRGDGYGMGMVIGSVVGGALGGTARLIGKGVNALLRDKEAYQEELAYYDQVISIIDESLSVQ
jgi:hypothetical protein